MDDPFHVRETGRDQIIYSNTSILEHMVRLQSQERCEQGFDLRSWVQVEKMVLTLNYNSLYLFINGP